MADEVVLESLKQEGEGWAAELSFRGARYSMMFQLDSTGRLRTSGKSPFNLTVEGHEVGRLIDRVRQGERLALPCRVEPALNRPNLTSVHDPDWNAPAVTDVWLDGAERVGDDRWLANLRVDGSPCRYEIQFYPGPGAEELHRPNAVGFDTFRFDLMKLLLRMNDGERFALPFKLRPRWPTPPDPPARP
jgi:hypothetical protein